MDPLPLPPATIHLHLNFDHFLPTLPPPLLPLYTWLHKCMVPYYLFSKIILFWHWFCFSIHHSQMLPATTRSVNERWWRLRWIFSRSKDIQQVQGFPLTNLRHIAILCTFFFVLSFLSSEIFLLTTTSKSESFNFFSFFLFCRLFQLHMFPAFFLMSLSVNFNQFLKQFQSCNFCHF